MKDLENIKRKLCFLTPPIVVKYLRKAQQAVRHRKAGKRLKNASRLHLGCGGNCLPGWHNIDMSGSGDVVKLDLAEPLPVASGSIQYIFSEHFLEHLTLSQGRRFLLECYRALASDGILRISTPNLESGFEHYKNKQIDLFKYRGWKPASPCQMVNEGMRLWGHQFVYDTEELSSLLKECGFSKIVLVGWHSSRHPELCNLECRPYHGDIILEAEK